MSGSHERGDERSKPSGDPEAAIARTVIDPDGRWFLPIDPVRVFLEAIASGELDAKTVLESLAEEGALDPGLLTRPGEEEPTAHPGESRMPTEKIFRTPDSGPGTGFRFVEVGLLGEEGMGFDPLDFISRLAAIVPRPRVHQIRYHGILAPNAAWRSVVVPSHGRVVRRRRHGVPTRGRWIRWAELMKRVFEQDMLRRDSCGGRREVIALIKERSVIEAILDSLDLPSTPPQVKPSWWERGQALIFG